MTYLDEVNTLAFMVYAAHLIAIRDAAVNAAVGLAPPQLATSFIFRRWWYWPVSTLSGLI
jgi:hypothetical protein